MLFWNYNISTSYIIKIINVLLFYIRITYVIIHIKRTLHFMYRITVKEHILSKKINQFTFTSVTNVTVKSWNVCYVDIQVR